MTHLQLVSGGDKLWTVPKACRRLDRATIHESCYGKCNPTHQVVYGSKLFHYFILFFCCNFEMILQKYSIFVEFFIYYILFFVNVPSVTLKQVDLEQPG